MLLLIATILVASLLLVLLVALDWVVDLTETAPGKVLLSGLIGSLLGALLTGVIAAGGVYFTLSHTQGLALAERLRADERERKARTREALADLDPLLRTLQVPMKQYRLNAEYFLDAAYGVEGLGDEHLDHMRGVLARVEDQAVFVVASASLKLASRLMDSRDEVASEVRDVYRRTRPDVDDAAVARAQAPLLPQVHALSECLKMTRMAIDQWHASGEVTPDFVDFARAALREGGPSTFPRSTRS